MMTEDEYRTEINKAKQFVSMKTLLKALNISSSNYFQFMSGKNSMLSSAKCDIILEALNNRPIGPTINGQTPEGNKTMKTISEIGYDVNIIQEEIRNKYDLKENWFGDTYGSMIENEVGMNLIIKASHAKTDEEYQDILDDIKGNFEANAK